MFFTPALYYDIRYYIPKVARTWRNVFDRSHLSSVRVMSLERFLHTVIATQSNGVIMNPS